MACTCLQPWEFSAMPCLTIVFCVAVMQTKTNVKNLHPIQLKFRVGPTSTTIPSVLLSIDTIEHKLISLHSVMFLLFISTYVPIRKPIHH